MFQANQQIGGYTLIKQIGRGGFGEVWLAERRTEILTTQVAIKLPHREQVNLVKGQISTILNRSALPNGQSRAVEIRPNGSDCAK